MKREGGNKGTEKRRVCLFPSLLCFGVLVAVAVFTAQEFFLSLPARLLFPTVVGRDVSIVSQ